MTETADGSAALRDDVRRLQHQVENLRSTVLRAACLAALVLVVVGALMPAWHDRAGDHPHTYRVVTAGVQGLQQGNDDGGSGFATAAGVGFLGLLVVIVLLLGVLVGSVMLGGGRSKNRWARTALVVLALLGVLVPLLFSTDPNSDTPDTSGGWGPLVLTVGLVASAWILFHRDWYDLWLDRARGAGLRDPLTLTGDRA